MKTRTASIHWARAAFTLCLLAAGILLAAEPRVEVLAPSDPARYAPPATIEVTAVATDPDGYAPRAELIVGNRVIDVSEIVFVVAPTNGTPIQHFFRWSNVPAGTYTYVVRATDDAGATGQSAARTVFVAPPPPTTVTLHTIDAEAAESSEGRLGTNTALFRLTRAGDLTPMLAVNLAREGVALNGVDYLNVPEIVRFAAGSNTLDVLVTPLNDSVAEEPEAVRFTILPGEGYVPGDAASATATIANHPWEHPPTIRLVSPDPTGSFQSPTNLLLRVEASGWEGRLGRVEFRDGTNVLGVRESEPFEMVWINAPAGSHALTARAADSFRRYTCDSPPVEISVKGPILTPSLAFITPTNGMTALVGAQVPIRVALSNPRQLPFTVILSADGRTLATGTGILSEFAFTNVFYLAGEFALSATAIDSSGVVLASAPVTLHVKPENALPWARIVNPERHAQLPASREIAVDVLAGDPDGRVQSVQFYLDTNQVGVATQPVADATNRYRVVVSIPEGRHTLRAVAIDHAGTRGAAAPVVVYVAIPPDPDPGIRLAEQPLARCSFAIGANGTLFQWDFTGASGISGLITKPLPVALPASAGRITSFSCGFNNGSPLIEGLAMDAGGGMSRWLTRYTNSGLVALPQGVTRWTSASAGSACQFAIGDNGELYAWGLNNNGVLGLGTNDSRGQILTQPTLVPRPAGVRGWRQVSATTHVLAIDADGILYSWGRNNAGQLGQTNLTETISQPKRVVVPDGLSFKQVSAGSFHSLALASSGDLYAWGTNEVGQLGVGKWIVLSSSPMKVPLPPGASRWVRISAGGKHSLAMTDDGSLYGWGANNVGQVGPYSLSSQNGGREFLPRRVDLPEATSEWLAFTAGDRQSLALTDDARLFAWGKTSDSDAIYSIQPVPGATRSILANTTNRPPAIELTTEPSNPAVILPGGLVTLRATASDPDSEIRWVEFFDGDSPLGTDTTAPYSLSKALTLLGRHELKARVVDAQGAQSWSLPVVMMVVSNQALPTVWITADSPSVTEAAMNAVGLARLHRSGDARDALNVNLRVGGNATAGVDYRLQSDAFTFKAGASTVDIQVFPIVDNLVEPAETVVLTLAASTNYTLASPESATITILDSTPPPVETSFLRRLPDVYVAGETLTANVSAQPPTNAAAWAVEEIPPPGWTVLRVSDDGVFDPLKGKVKFGPFFRAEARVLTYELKAPAGATNAVEFSGTASVDGVNSAIRGDRIIQPGALRHPADRAEADFSLGLAEVTGYAAAWRQGVRWSSGPDPIPADYVTRAGFLWRAGEIYHFDGGAGAAPLCWQPGLAGAGTDPGALDFPLGGKGTRGLSTAAPWVVSLIIEPAAGISNYAVEESLPPGASAEGISHDGQWDPATRTVRWGPFFDDNPRTLTYTVNLPTGIAAHALSGKVSLDGRTAAIGGNLLVVPEANGRPWLGVERAGDGTMDLLLFGATGRACRIEWSADGVQWEVLGTVEAAASPHRLNIDTPSSSTQRYYRVRMAP